MKLICCLLLLAGCAPAQTPAFDAASIKPDNSGPGPSSMRVTAGHLAMQNVSLKKILLNAYNIPDDREYAVIGPEWLGNEHFDMEATFPADTQIPQIRLMMQSFLSDRFKMAAHKETRQLPNYSLVVAKGGVKISPAEAGQGQTSGGNGKFTATKITMGHFADLIARQVGFPVADQTGLAGVYTFTLQWDPAAGFSVGPSEAPPTGPSIFTALEEQLGLHLASGKGPAEVVVIDRMEKTPTEN
ncbi:MAG TPA: TIGR03435 family protein [Bryobacteraceae bacterium]|nr:TIGR03435 family protein [Bryobacteraceae bacterium]